MSGDESIFLTTRPRALVMVLIDSSLSMSGGPIDQINASLPVLKEELGRDSIASVSADLAVIRFGDRVEVVQDWTLPENFSPSPISAAGATPLGGALLTALDMIESRKQYLRDNETNYYQPLMFILTDGEPNDGEWPKGAAACMKAIGDKKVNVFAFCSQSDANQRLEAEKKLLECTPKVFELSSDPSVYRELFQWISAQSKRVSHADVGQKTKFDMPPQSKFSSLLEHES